MLKTILTQASFAQDEAAQIVLRRAAEAFADDEGYCYYKHPVVQGSQGAQPDFVLFTRNHQPLLLKTLNCRIEEIGSLDEETWEIQGHVCDSPLLELEELALRLESKFREQRELRILLRPRGILALPFISQEEFSKRKGLQLEDAPILWQESPTTVLVDPLRHPLSDEAFTLTRAIMQGATSLSCPRDPLPEGKKTMGTVIQALNQQMAALDDEQERAMLQIAPGPQRIHGLPGTGKTVLLAMKAAYLHVQNPDKKILFTFNTKSLYRPIRDLIAATYRAFRITEPNWDLLHVRHVIGQISADGREIAYWGVYEEICDKQEETPLDPRQMREGDNFLEHCFAHALQNPIPEKYDYILVDEAQDLPKEFFQVLYKISRSPEHRIYWTWDESPNAFALESAAAETLFGEGKDGKPLIFLTGEDYPGPIKKDIVLHRSYRCSQIALRLAHIVGLGLYNVRGGQADIIKNREYWEMLGYTLKSGQLQKNDEVVIACPMGKSQSRVDEILSPSELVTTHVFPDRDAETDWLVKSIKRDLEEENVTPNQILVISLDSSNSEEYLRDLHLKLLMNEIESHASDNIDSFVPFMDYENWVYLSDVQHVNGHEASVVYVARFDALYQDLAAIAQRSAAFTALTRSKAWVRISGQGLEMALAKREIDTILAAIPQFTFKVADTQELLLFLRNADTVDRHLDALIKVKPETLKAFRTEKLGKLRQWLDEVAAYEHKRSA